MFYNTVKKIFIFIFGGKKYDLLKMDTIILEKWIPFFFGCQKEDSKVVKNAYYA